MAHKTMAKRKLAEVSSAVAVYVPWKSVLDVWCLINVKSKTAQQTSDDAHKHNRLSCFVLI